MNDINEKGDDPLSNLSHIRSQIKEIKNKSELIISNTVAFRPKIPTDSGGKNFINKGKIESPIFKNGLLPNLYKEEEVLVNIEKILEEKGISIPVRTGDTPKIQKRGCREAKIYSHKYLYTAMVRFISVAGGRSVIMIWPLRKKEVEF